MFGAHCVPSFGLYNSRAPASCSGIDRVRFELFFVPTRLPISRMNVLRLACDFCLKLFPPISVRLSIVDFMNICLSLES